MGAASSSQPVPRAPIIDYRLFRELTSSKSSNTYTIAPTFISEMNPSTGYRALIHLRHRKDREDPDIELFRADSEAKDGLGDCVGVVRFIEKGKVKFVQGNGEQCELEHEIMMKAERNKNGRTTFEFAFEPHADKGASVRKPRQPYVWQISKHTGLGNVKEMILRVKPEVEPEEGEQMTEEKGGEIVGVWKKRGFWKGGEGSFWIKNWYGMVFGTEGDKVWEEVVVLSGLGMLEGRWW